MTSTIRAFALLSGLLGCSLVACQGKVIVGDVPEGGFPGEGGGIEGGVPEGGVPTGPSCAAAGGTCIIGPGTNCATLAPSGAQDCNPTMNPGGAECCLALVGSEGGPPAKAGKVDLLFDIDNSASMGDKQAYLAQAVPDLVARLVQPNCIMTSSGGTVTIVGKSTNGMCPSGGTLEFPPVHDMHVGVISSSLGTRGVTGGGQVCDPNNKGTNTTPPFPSGKSLPSHVDDRGELLNRASSDVYTESPSVDTGGQGFLDWFPSVAANAGKLAAPPPQALSPVATAILDAPTLEKDFAELIIGAHYYGCGIESQLESWYRFLVQPDPYDSIVIDTSGHAQWSGVDATIIKQRHDFLRPDSLVAIIDLTDENDSEIDVRSFGGQGYKFMDQNFQPPHGTSACALNPASPKCTSCAYGGTGSDPACKAGANTYTAEDDPGFYINVRHVHMQQKYGIVPQFPLGRYVVGLTSSKVPDRFHEYPPGATSYQGGTVYDTATTPATLKDPDDLNCTNPLFAASLPDGSDLSVTGLCNVAGAGGPRSAGLVFYLHIGGVPHQLVQSIPGDGTCPMGTPAADCPQKDTLAPTDWSKILGQGWETIPSPASSPNVNEYDYTGIDPHMIESHLPRPGLVALTSGPGPMGGGADPINGGEWVTNGTVPVTHELPVDREYACIFPLVDPSTGAPTPRDCTSPDYSVQESCDCSVIGLAKDAVPAVCGLNSAGTQYTMQYYAKAYPTIRELQLAELLGNQGVVSSLCPIHTVDQAGGNDPLYGYRPAISALIDRMRPNLGP